MSVTSTQMLTVFVEKNRCKSRDSDFKVNPATETHSPSQSSQPMRHALLSVHSDSEWTLGAYIPTDHKNITAIFINLILNGIQVTELYAQRGW